MIPPLSTVAPAVRPVRAAVPSPAEPVLDTVTLGASSPPAAAPSSAPHAGPAPRADDPLHDLLTRSAQALLSMVPTSPALGLVIPAATSLHAVATPPPPDLDAAALRVWQRGPAGPELADVDALPLQSSPPPPPHAFKPLDYDDLEQEMNRIAKARMSAMKHLDRARTAPRAVPKDCTLRPSSFDMSFESSDEASKGYIDQMARIGRREGFHLVARAREGSENELIDAVSDDAYANLTVVPLPGAGDVWLEDHGEVTVSDTVSVPAHVGDSGLIDDAILRDRVSRLFGERLDTLSGDDLEDEVDARFPRAAFSRQGAVDERYNQEALVALAMSAGMKARQDFSYLEGGNVMPGTLPGGEGYVLVGRDSVAITRALLERDLGRAVTDAEARLAIAKDLGVKPENVHPVEQPGAFHIDMAMGLLGPGQVVLNDAREAARLQTQWLRDDAEARRPQAPPADASFLRKWVHRVRDRVWQWTTGDRVEQQAAALAREAESRAWYEDRTAADLHAAGLDVKRAALVFMNPNRPSDDVANFANIRQGTNPAGERFVIALGGPKRAEAHVAKTLLADIDCGVSRVWFLDRALTPLTLDLSGGIKCRSKGEGTVAPT